MGFGIFWPIENGGFSYCQVGSYEVTQLWQKPHGSDALAARKAPALVGVRTSAASADWKRSEKKKKKRDAVRSWYQFFDGEYPPIKQLTNKTINQPININKPTSQSIYEVRYPNPVILDAKIGPRTRGYWCRQNQRKTRPLLGPCSCATKHLSLHSR